MIKTTKKVFRSDDDYMIAGVCGGLGEYFGIDASLVRILFVLLAIGGGAGIIIYIVLALIMPKEGQETADINIDEVAQTIGSKVKKISKEVKNSNRINIFGLVLILMGGIFLWNRFGFFRIDGEIFWPAILMIVGFSILFKRK